jgi:hypothetical protein
MDNIDKTKMSLSEALKLEQTIYEGLKLKLEEAQKAEARYWEDNDRLVLLQHIKTLATAIEDALYSLYQNQYMPTHKVDDTANILKSALLKVWEDTDQSAKKNSRYFSRPLQWQHNPDPDDFDWPEEPEFNPYTDVDVCNENVALEAYYQDMSAVDPISEEERESWHRYFKAKLNDIRGELE